MSLAQKEEVEEEGIGASQQKESQQENNLTSQSKRGSSQGSAVMPASKNLDKKLAKITGVASPVQKKTASEVREEKYNKQEENKLDEIKEEGKEEENPEAFQNTFLGEPAPVRLFPQPMFQKTDDTATKLQKTFEAIQTREIVKENTNEVMEFFG